MLSENALNIFTDGSSLRSPRRGGIGIRFILVDALGQEELQDAQLAGYIGATNNQMELKACIMALEDARRLHLTDGVSKVVIFTDSIYVSDLIGKAMFEWPKTRWLSHTGRPVLNVELWKQLTAAIEKTGMRVEFKWVRGHAKSVHNRAADRMARQSAASATNKALSIVHVRRKYSKDAVEVGCVPMSGQRLSVHIIDAQFLSTQHVWKCKYEVITKRSKYYSLVDIVFSDEILKAGHSYYVQLNRESKNPRIVKVFREIGAKSTQG